jgi:hypothetical protein
MKDVLKLGNTQSNVEKGKVVRKDQAITEPLKVQTDELVLLHL